MNRVVQELKKLIIDNPELEVLTLVREDTYSESWWSLGDILKVKVEEYCQAQYDDELMIFRSNGPSDEFMDHHYGKEHIFTSAITPEGINKAFDQLPWRLAIFVYVGPYEEQGVTSNE